MLAKGTSLSYFRFPVVGIITLAFFLLLRADMAHAWNYYLPFQGGNVVPQKKEPDIKTEPVRTIQNVNEKGLEITYRFSGAHVSLKDINSQSFQALDIDGFTNFTEIGAPALPVHNEIIAMPPNADPVITVLEVRSHDFKGYNIPPTRKLARDTYGADEPEYQMNTLIYDADQFYPEQVAAVTNTVISRGTPLAIVQIRPVAVNQVTRTLRVYELIRFRISFENTKKDFSRISNENSLHYTNLLKRSVLNSAVIPDGMAYLPQESGSSKNYIIITHQQFIDQANKLAEWKRQLGYSVEVVSQPDWSSTQVKDAIHSRYDAWTPKPDYFVIIGDHTGPYAVPGEIRLSPDNHNFATDLYYACMDGASDYTPDMAHGRISVTSTTEAETIINKIIDYEKTPVTTASFYNNMMNCAMYQDDNNDGYADRRFCHTSENIRDYLQTDQGYTSQRIYYTDTSFDKTQLRYNNGTFSNGQLLPTDLRDPGFDWNGSDSDITAGIDDGKFLIFHRDHGYVGGSGWANPYYTTTTMTNLNNGDLLPIVFSINCHTGEFQLNECFAEKFLRMSGKGAAGVVAAAYYSYSGYNDAFAIGMIDAIWSDPGLVANYGSYDSGAGYSIGSGNDIYTMGDVMNQGLVAMVQNIVTNESDFKYTHELYHYFGDPAMRIWTANPNTNPISASHPASIDCQGSTFTVSGSTPEAVATLIQNDQLLSRVILDGSGSANLSYALISNDAVTLTISKHNCKPYTAEVPVSGSCIFHGILAFSNQTSSIFEDEAPALVNVSRVNGSSGYVSISCSTADGTASAGSDYTAVSNQILAWSDGETNDKYCSIPIIEDRLEENDETVILTLSNPTGGATSGSPTTAELTIHDNDRSFSLQTTFIGGNGSDGNMFDVKALHELTIDSFTCNSDTVNDGTFDAAVYYRQGEYSGYEQDSSAWILVGSAADIVSNGPGQETELPIVIDITIPKSATYAFYITTTDESNLKYTDGTVEGAVYVEDAGIQFFEGVGKAYPFNNTYRPRVWNGIINYHLADASINCSGDVVVLENITFKTEGTYQCQATTSITTGTNVTIEEGANVTFIAPLIKLNPDFHGRPNLKIQTSP